MKRLIIIAAFLILTLTGCASEKSGASFQPSETKEIDNGLASSIEKTPKETNKSEEDIKNNISEVDSEIIEINEKVFLAQIDDIYYNYEDYKDKTIKLEGMYGVFYSWDGESSASVVYRNGPGCCGNDGWGGFLLNYDGEYPSENDWIEVIGKPELVANDEFMDLYLNVISIKVMEVRGAEFVSQ
ncbi:hypothetical protein [Tissierella sp. Yu-01]|uniref:TIGR03943 family putative permease subunit n=1 Tax=Tissierella sp. Yu-01 TaxID=3035694 RepID=UPI00240CEE18|nr:hypothetical protein [Tissierella sp. Yu-01]WFA08936.1 hypothetical protein P3962_14615 [Tissierella sp. Yu-01]